MAFEMTPEMKEVQMQYGSSHGYSINKGLAVPDVSPIHADHAVSVLIEAGLIKGAWHVWQFN